MTELKNIKVHAVNFITIMGETLSTTISNLLVAFILTSKFGLSYYGELALYQAIFLSYSVLMKPVTWQAIVKFVTLTDLHRLVVLSFKLELLFIVFSMVLALIIFPFFNNINPMLFFFLSIAYIVINNGTIIGANRAQRNYLHTSILIFISSVSKVLLCVYSEFNPLEIFLCLILCDFITWCIYAFLFYFLFKNRIIRKSDDEEVKADDFIRFSLWGTFHLILDLPVKHFDKILIAYLFGNAATGVLDLAKRLSQVVAQIFVPLNTIIYPRYVDLVANRNLKRILKLNSNVTFALVLVSVVFLLIAYTFFDIFDSWFTSGTMFEYRNLVLGFLVVQLFALILSWLHPLSLALGSMKLIASSILLSNVIYVLIIYLFSSFFELYAVLLAFAIQVSFVLILKARNVRHMLKAFQ